MDLFSWLCLISASLFMIYAAWVDWRTYTIPYVSIAGVAIAGLLFRYHQGTLFTEVLLAPILIGLFLLLVSTTLSRLRDKPMLGYGDLQLMIASLIWIDLSHVSLFFVTAGLSGLLLSFMHRSYFPFAPGIGIAWLVSVFL